jgi:flagellar motor switch protein FliN/FliY
MLELAKNAAPQLVELPELKAHKTAGGPVFDGPLGLIQSVKVRLAASLGSATLTVAELAALKDGAVLKLDRAVGEPVDIVLEGQVIARGRLVAVEDSFGVSITEIASLPRS